jgi:hypothetical protein
MDTSATMICHAARSSVFGFAAGPPAASVDAPGNFQLAPRLPAYPEEKNSSCEEQSYHFQKLDGESCKANP